MEKLKMQTPDLTEQNIEKIARIFPNVITEKEDESGNIVKGIDFDLLRQALSKELVENEDERYRLDWPGKKASILKANTPINKTLRPVKEESENFDTTHNLFLEGDNFEILKILQESYLNKVKMIYIDPPYNTGKDFIYSDNFKKSRDEYEEEIGLYDEEGGKLFKNTDTNGRFHSDWLSMMYERLVIARDLLKEDGVIFVSIDDNEVANLRKIMDECFGEENFVAQIVWERAFSPKNDAKFFSENHDYILVYAKQIDFCKIKRLARTEESANRYKNPDNDVRGSWVSGDLTVKTYSKKYDYPIVTPSGRVVNPAHGSCWRVSEEKFKKLVNDNRIWFGPNGDNVPRLKRFFSEVQMGMVPTTLWKHKDVGHNQEGRQELKSLFIDKGYFDGPKPVRLIKRILELSDVKNNEVVVDFFSGSSTTAHSVLQLNAEDGGSRKFIMAQLPEPTDEKSEAYKAGYKTIADIGKERIRLAGKKIKQEFLEKYQKELEKLNTVGELEFDDEKKAKKEELQKKIAHIKNLDTGFRVYKTNSSCMRDVYYHPAELSQEQLDMFISNIKEDRTPEDLLTQVMLDLGLELSLPIEEKTFYGNRVFFVQGNSLAACFDEAIDFRIVDEIAKTEPLKVVFRDAGFKDDKDRINVETRFKRLSPETQVTVI